MAVAFHSERIEIQEDDTDYDDVETKTTEDDPNNHLNVETKTAQQKHQKMLQSVRRRYRMLGWGFGLLCGVQTLLNIGLRLSLYSEWTEEKNNLVKDLDELQSRYNNTNSEWTEEKNKLVKDLDELQSRYNNITEQNEKMRHCGHTGLPGWQIIGRVCYYISTTESKTWEESRQYCRDRQSDLIIINSKEEQDFVNSNGQYVWLGLTDREREGAWKWVDGTPLTTPTYWCPGEPNDIGKEDCAVSSNGKGTAGWNDIPCDTRATWMCEIVL